MSHYLRTGRLLLIQYKRDGLGKELTRRLISEIVRLKYGKPNDVLVDHYFFAKGQTFDLVGRGLLEYITGTRVFEEVYNKFKLRVIEEVIEECRKLLKSDNIGQSKKYQKEISERQPINFTREFFL